MFRRKRDAARARDVARASRARANDARIHVTSIASVGRGGAGARGTWAVEDHARAMVKIQAWRARADETREKRRGTRGRARVRRKNDVTDECV